MNFFRIFPILCVGTLLSTGLMAQNSPTQSSADQAIMTLDFGKKIPTKRVVINLFEKDCPLTVANFQKLVADKFYNGLRFHKVIPDALVQTGDPYSRFRNFQKSGSGGPKHTVPAEIRLPIVKGSVAMARLPDPVNPTKRSNGSQFFVALKPLPDLSGKYTVFGQVVEGLEILEALSKESANSNDFPLTRMKIQSIKMTP